MQNFWTVYLLNILDSIPLSIFRILQENLFSFLFIISATFYANKDIKIDHSIFHVILKKKF